MKSLNDKKIIELRKIVEEKKANLRKVKFTPITNCSIEIENNRYNLNVQSKENLTLILIKLNSYLISMKDLGISKLEISGYALEDWVTDIKLKLEVISQKIEENNLKDLEKKLSTLLSDDKKTELELNDIANLLK